MDEHAQNAEQSTPRPDEVAQPIKRKHICPSAGYWRRQRGQMSSTGTIAHGVPVWTVVDGEQVGIEVNAEPADIGALERCFRCAMPTNFWYLPHNVACCPDCAFTLRASQVPTHEQWMKDHAHLQHVHPQRPDEEYYRADGTCLCVGCKKPYTGHPKVPGRAWLNQLCDGTLVKL